MFDVRDRTSEANLIEDQAQALIEEARQRQRRRRAAIAWVILLVLAGAGAWLLSGGGPPPKAGRRLHAQGTPRTPASAVQARGATDSAVGIPVTVDSVFSNTPIVRRFGIRWWASATSLGSYGTNYVRIYRWRKGQWRLSGLVRVGEIPPLGGGGGGLQISELTHSRAPDFTLTTSGADWRPFVIIARSGGRWHLVPFQAGSARALEIDYDGVSQGLVHAKYDGCGCAVGPETYSWYRYRRGRFVPSASPAGSPPCSAAVLDGSSPLPGGYDVGLPWTRSDLSKPLALGQVSCADDWALATVRSSSDALALYEHTGHQWLRAAVATPRQLAANISWFALPRSVLATLAASLRLPLPPARHHARSGTASPFGHFNLHLLPAIERAKIHVRLTPGSTYSSSYAGNLETMKDARWFATGLQTRRGRESEFTVNFYRRHANTWKKNARVQFALPITPPGTEPQTAGVAVIQWPALHGLQPSFEVTNGGDPGWTAVISHQGGRWHLVPFVTDGQRRITSNASLDNSLNELIAYNKSDQEVIYQPAGGVLKASAPRTVNCAPRVPRGLLDVRTACAYGYAIAEGTSHGKQVAAIFTAESSPGWVIATPGYEAPKRLETTDASIINGYPRWVARELIRKDAR